MARLSKKLVTLDDHVKLDVPIGELAVHEPDHKRLIAFLKAMEFSSLTRRVAEFAGIDAGAIEPDARLAVGGSSFASPVAGEGGATRRASAGEGRAGRASFSSPGRLRRRPPPRGGRCERRAHAAGACRRALRSARTAEIRSRQIRNRAQPRPAQSLDRTRARRRRFVAIDTETTSLDPMQAELCGFSLAVAPNEACYVPLGHRQGGDGGGGLFQGERGCRIKFPSGPRSM